MHARDAEADAALFRELEGVGEQVLDHLLQTLVIGVDGARQIRSKLDLEVELLVLRNLREGAVDMIAQGRERGFADIQRDGAGFDLGEVQNIVDEAEKVGTGMMDRTGEFDLFVGQIALGVLGQELGQDQQAVQRRPQFVAHIGQEFRLVL